jgi:hypothetical protein
MLRTLRLLPALLVASAAFLPVARAQAVPRSDLFPLGAGDRWSYTVSAGGSPVGTEDVRVVPVATNVAGGLENYFGNGNVSVVSETAGGLVFEAPAPKLLWYALHAPVGASWWFHSSSASGGWNMVHATVISRTATVDVPAGHFVGCVQIAYLRLSGNGPGPIEEVFAPGVGLVRRTVATPGPRTWELSSAVVGGQPLPAMPIEVSIGLDRDAFIFGGPVPILPPPTRIHVRLTVRSDVQAETFQFPTTQRFDVRVRDAQGAEIWLWSKATGQIFQPTPGSETAGPGAPLFYDIDVPVVQGGGGGNGRTPDEYQIEAILWDEHAASGQEVRMARTLYTVMNVP